MGGEQALREAAALALMDRPQPPLPEPAAEQEAVSESAVAVPESPAMLEVGTGVKELLETREKRALASGLMPFSGL